MADTEREMKCQKCQYFVCQAVPSAGGDGDGSTFCWCNQGACQMPVAPEGRGARGRKERKQMNAIELRKLEKKAYTLCRAYLKTEGEAQIMAHDVWAKASREYEHAFALVNKGSGH